MKKNKKAYSVVVAILMVWFLLVMVIWVYNMIIKELNDNRWMWNYYKTYYWAEAWQELALLKIKEKWYGYYDKIDLDVNDRSILLADNSTDKFLYNWWNDVIISYDLNSKTNSYSWKLNNLEYDIIPLFYLTWSSIEENKVNNIKLIISSWEQSDLVWNILSQSGWISWTWAIDSSSIVDTFLLNNSNNYLIITNWWITGSDIQYTLSSQNTEEYFTKPRIEILSSAKIKDYKQNLTTKLDNTEYLWFLKYSIYSD